MCHGCLAEIANSDTFCSRCGEWVPGLAVVLPLESSMIQARFLGQAWTAVWRGNAYSPSERFGAGLVLLAGLPFWLPVQAAEIGLLGLGLALLLAHEAWLAVRGAVRPH